MTKQKQEIKPEININETVYCSEVTIWVDPTIRCINCKGKKFCKDYANPKGEKYRQEQENKKASESKEST